MRTDKKHKNTDKKIKFNNILMDLGGRYILSSSSISVQCRKTGNLWRDYIQQCGRFPLEVLRISFPSNVASANLPPTETLLTHVQHPHTFTT